MGVLAASSCRSDATLAVPMANGIATMMARPTTARVRTLIRPTG